MEFATRAASMSKVAMTSPLDRRTTSAWSNRQAWPLEASALAPKLAAIAATLCI